MLMELNGGKTVICDDRHRTALRRFHWRAYTHDHGRTWEVATDLSRDGKRTTMMLSRFLMERIMDRELDQQEKVRRLNQCTKSGHLDYRDRNLVLREYKLRGKSSRYQYSLLIK